MALTLTAAVLPPPMRLAIEAARGAADLGEVPVGAVITDRTGRVLSTTHNMVEAWTDPTAHAEMLAIQSVAQQRGKARLEDCDLYVTLEPCPMCAGAIAHSRFRRVYFGAWDPKSGGVDHGARVFDHPQCHHRPEVMGGVDEQDCAALLKAFFEARRQG